jgi:hypothetical protein
MTDNTPDFSSMSMEEMMAWMESLAKRQGATEGFMTDADVDVPEVDPATAVIDEPGYVPYGQEGKTTPPAPTLASTPVSAPASPPPVSIAPPAPAPPAAPPPPVPQPELPRRPAAEAPPPAMPETMPVLEFDLLADEAETTARPAMDQNTLAWLESLAAGQNDALFNLDLSAFDDSTPEPEEDADTQQLDPQKWLEQVAMSQGELRSETAVAAEAPADEFDTMMWLESLAVRQGARSEELVTPANLDVPAPEGEVEENRYTPFSYDLAQPVREPRPPQTLDEPVNPVQFLSDLAAEEGYSEDGVTATKPQPEAPEVDMTIPGIERAISNGTVTPEQMQVWMDYQTERGLARPDPDLEPEAEADTGIDADAPPQQAELPGWLLEHMQGQPTDDLDDLEAILSDTAGHDMSWVNGALEAEASTSDPEVQAIFAVGSPVDDANPLIEADPDDQWAQAFDLEQMQDDSVGEVVPEWYTRNLSDPTRIAQVEGMAAESLAAASALSAVPTGLSDEPLPIEPIYAPAEAIELPEWVANLLPAAEPVMAASAGLPAFEEADEEAIEGTLPDWLRELEGTLESTEDVPAWLLETIEEEQEPEPVFARREPEPLPVPTPPAPAMPPAADLESAREAMRTGNIDAGLTAYDALLRAGRELDAVVQDMMTVAQVHKGNPVVYRVLGDGYMRQGKLQLALNTYRQALDQL